MLEWYEMKNIQIIFCIIIVSIVSGCTSQDPQHRIQTALLLAQQTGFKPVTFNTSQFKLASFRKFKTSSPIVAVYIEGDGFAWIDRYTISRNPTPFNPMALKLATVDKSANVIYIARPCQYIELSQERYCSNQYWTSHRFSKEVIDSYNQVLDQISSTIQGVQYHLIGFSGGGAIVALLAEQRSDVVSLRTIAGNLDHVALNKKHNVSQLTGSLNAITKAADLRNLPQIHYSGEDDKTVPSWVAHKFVKAVGVNSCIKTISVAGASHFDGWLSYWVGQSAQLPSC